MSRGELWMYEFKRPDKRRPVVVLSREDAIPFLHSVIVAPVTRVIRGLPSEVRVDQSVGLKAPSAINLDHIQVVEQSSLSHFIGRLAAPQMRAVCAALAIAVGCDEG